jgi:hypothetical protein
VKSHGVCRKRLGSLHTPRSPTTTGRRPKIFHACRKDTIDPHAYLVDVMRRIKNATPDELESLLPDRWLQEHPEARLEQRARESHAAAHRKRARRAARRATAAKR